MRLPTLIRILKSLILLIIFLPLTVLSQKKDSLSNKGSIAVYPAFGYQPETSAQLGAIAVWVLPGTDSTQSEFYRPSSVTPFFLYTIRKQVLTAVNFDLFLKNGSNLVVSPRYYDFPNIYFGIGNDNDPDSSENYTNQFLRLFGRYFIPLNPKTFVGFAFDIQKSKLKKLDPDGRLVNENVNGVNGGTEIGFGPAFKYDSRDNTLYPSKGYLISSQIVAVLAGNFRYVNYWFDFRKYIHLRNPKDIIAFNVNANLTSGDDIPFYKLPQLGGDERLRGIANASLYQDKQSFFSQIEYRRHLFWRCGMVAFAGIGDVTNRISNFRLDEFKYVLGMGGRFAAVKEEKINIRVDMGLGKGGQSALYISLREAF